MLREAVASWRAWELEHGQLETIAEMAARRAWTDPSEAVALSAETGFLPRAIPWAVLSDPRPEVQFEAVDALGELGSMEARTND